MKTEKLSLKSIKNVLSRNELKKIMAGSGSCGTLGAVCDNGTAPPCCVNLICYVGPYAPSGTCIPPR